MSAIFVECQLLSHPSNHLPQPVTDFIAQHKVPVVTDATMLLGAPIGWRDNKKLRLLEEIAAKLDPMFEMLNHASLPAQETMGLLRYCTLPSLGYLQRVVPPRLLQPIAQEFDRKILAVAVNKLGLPQHISDRQRLQLQLKIKHGGFGLASAADTSPIAHTACVFSSINTLLEPLVLGTHGLQSETHFRNDVTHAINRTRALVHTTAAAALIPPAAELTGDRPTVLTWIKEHTEGAHALPKKLQSVLSHAADRQRIEAMLFHADKATRAILLAASAKHAAAWSGAIPSERALKLSNKEFSYASRMRLG